MTGEAAKKLRALRKRAYMTMQNMADVLGMKKSSYQHYEDAYKKDYLPPDMAAKVTRALIARGVPESDARALTFVEPVAPSPEASLEGDTDLSHLLVDLPNLDTECVIRAALEVMSAIREHEADWMPEEVTRAITENAAHYTREKNGGTTRVISVGGKLIPLPRNTRWPN